MGGGDTYFSKVNIRIRKVYLFPNIFIFINVTANVNFIQVVGFNRLHKIYSYYIYYLEDFGALKPSFRVVTEEYFLCININLFHFIKFERL